jgi:CRP/FNR family cyclic AMP-dependent transcriptional regulator
LDNFLASLSSEERSGLEQLGRRKVFPAGTVIVHEGIVGDGIMLLLRGVVKISYVTQHGSEVVLGFCRQGQIVGELSVIDRQPRSSTVTVMETAEAVLLSSTDFLAFIEKEPRATMAILRTVIARLRDTDRRLIEFGASDALGRVASRLVELCSDYGQPSERGVTITLGISQDELASWAGCSKKSLVISLQTLRRLGLIETARLSITVLDPDGLRAFNK